MTSMCHLNSQCYFWPLFLLLQHISSSAAMYCDVSGDENYNSQIYLYPIGSLYTVIGRGRLFFYSAPDERCIQKEIFIIPGDQMNAYTEYSDFISVMYIDAHGKDTEGWVKRDRLQEVKPKDE